VEAIFVGGGVIGLSGAWRAAQKGLRVTVVDPDPGRGASWVAAGMLAPVTEAGFGEETLVRLLVAGADRWAAFAADLAEAGGTDVGYRSCGTVVVAVDRSDRAVVDELLAFQQALGLRAERLSASECRRLVPALAPGVRGGAAVPGDHQVDNRRLVAALLAACQRSGVTVLREAAVAVTGGAGGGAARVRLRDGQVLEAGAVVVAAGAESGLLEGVPCPRCAR
jgi:glycine oxidase